MGIRVKIHSFMRGALNNKEEIECNGDTVQEALQDAVRQYPKIKPYLFDNDNRLTPFLNIYVNSTHIELLQREETKLRSGDEILIIPLIGGG